MDDEQQVNAPESVDNTDNTSAEVPFESLSADEMRAALIARDEERAAAPAEPAATAAEPEEPTAEADTTSEQAAPPQPVAPAEDWERKAHSYAGNNRQLQEQNRALLQQYQQLQQQQAQMQQQMEDFQAVQQIRQQVPAEYADQAEQEYRQRKAAERQQASLLQGAEQYRQYLQSENDQLAAARLDLFRQQLPQAMPDFAEYVAQATDAPPEPLRAVLQTKAFQDVYRYVHDQNDLDLVGQVLAGVAEHLKGQEDQRKTGNRETASATGRHRAETGTGVAGGPTFQQQIAGLHGDDWEKFAAKFRAEHQ